MKRFYSLALAALAVLLLPLAPAWSAMTQYQFLQTTGSEITVTSPTTAINSGVDDVVSGGLSIGFTFNFDGTNYTTFSVTDNGVMGLGSTNVTTTYSNSLTTGSVPIIAPFWDDLLTGTNGSVTYGTQGTAGSRILVVTWRLAKWPGGVPYSLTYQARLYEGSNRIEFWYGTSTTTGFSASIGAKESASNYASITSSSSTASVSYTVVNNSSSVFPSNGTVFQLSPCVNNITIAGNTAQGGTATMAGGDAIFSGQTVQRGNNQVFQPFTVTNPANGCGTRTFTYTITGTNAADYQLSTGGGTLTLGQSNTPNITFTPSGTGVRGATLTVTDNNGFSRAYALSAQGTTRITWTGIIAQGGTATVASGDTLMSNIEVQRLSSANFTPVRITNFNANAAAPAAPVTATINDPSGQYTISGPTSASLGANQSYSPVVRFAPTGVGFQNATLTITADGETRVYPLKAYATAPGGEFFINNVKLSPSVPLYSNYMGCVGEVANTQAVTVLNVGSGDFVINSIDVFRTDTTYGQGTPRFPLLRDRFGNAIRMSDYFISTTPGVAPRNANQAVQYPIIIPQNQSRTIYLTYVGQEPGKRYGRILFNTNGQNFTGSDINGVTQSGLLVVDLFGRGIGGELSDNIQGGMPKTMIFADTRVGDSVDVTYNVFNTGDCDLRISFEKLAITTGDVTDFRLLNAFGRTVVEGVPMTGEAVLAPDSSSSITVRFKPQRGGSRRATLWLQTNDSARFDDGVSERGAYYIDLYGFGKAGLDYSNLKLGPAIIDGASSEGVVTIVNSSTVNIGIASFTLIGGDALQFGENAAGGAWPVGLPMNLAPGAELKLGVRLTPTGTPGPRSTTLQIVTTTGEVIDIAITGEAGSQALSVSPGRLFVGALVTALEQKREIVMISNTGTLPIRILSTTISGVFASDYSLGNLPRLVIGPGAVEYLEVTYSPANPNVTSTATLTIVSDAGTQTVTLEGMSQRAKHGDVDPTGTLTGRGGITQPEIGMNLNGTSSVREAAAAAAGVRFDVVRPNPARERAELVYALAHSTDVRLELYDGAGRMVREVASGTQVAGEHRVTVDVSDLTAGVYYCRLSTGSVELSRNVIVVR